MNPELAQKWEDAYTVLWQALNAAPDHGIEPGGKHYRKLARVNAFKRAKTAFDKAGADSWESGRKAFLRSGPMSLDYGAGIGENETTTKMLAMGLALARGEFERIAPHERWLAEAAAPHLPWLRLPPSAPRTYPRVDIPPGATVMAPAVFAWRQESRRGVKNGLCVGSTQLRVTGLAAESAPVVMALPLPNGGRLELRKFGDEWLRPVLSPGSWTPCPTGLMFEALATGEPWRDSPIDVNPTGSRRGRHGDWFGPAMGINDIADREPAPSAGDALRIVAREAVVQKSSEGLYAIDGVAWKSTSEPRVVIQFASQHHADPARQSRSVALATWRLDGLTPLAPQDTATKDWLKEFHECSLGDVPFDLGIGSLVAMRAFADESNKQGATAVLVQTTQSNFLSQFRDSLLPFSQGDVDFLGAAPPPADLADIAHCLRRVMEALEETAALQEARAREGNEQRLGRYTPAQRASFTRAGKLAAQASDLLRSGDPASAMRASELLSAFRDLTPDLWGLGRTVATMLPDLVAEEAARAKADLDEDAIAAGFAS